jgi:AcrR family transcriptional regulator
MLPCMTPLRASDHRLSVDDWINAGFAILSDAGPNTLRIDRLCDRLGVTKGSFYWHFADMSAYHTALVDAWASLRDQDRRRFEAIYDLDPRERLCVMMASLVSPRYWELERVMRVWALTDEAVEASVRASDRRVLRAVRQALLDYGFKPDDANLRALVMFTAGIGFLHSANAAQDAPPELRERFMDFMLRP